MVYVTCLHPTAHSRAIDLSMTKKQLVLPEKTLKQNEEIMPASDNCEKNEEGVIA